MGWTIEYWDSDSSSWVAESASFKYIKQELNGHEEAVFYVANNSTTRDRYADDVRIRIKYDDTVVWRGIVTRVELRRGTIKCTAYIEAYALLSKRVHPSGSDHSVEYLNTSASTILTNILDEAGVVKGSCPTTTRSVRFERANCFEAAKWLAKALDKDFWGDYDDSDNPRFNIGTRVIHTLVDVEPISWPKRVEDRSKKYTKVIVRGVDADGNYIEGTAGTGDDVIVFTEKKAADQDTLNAIAERLLSKYQLSERAVKVPLRLTGDEVDAYELLPGDTVMLYNDDLGLSGQYRIWRITKYPQRVIIEVRVPEMTVEDAIEDVRGMEDYGIYPITSARLKLQSGTSFPSDPFEGQLFYRTDEDITYRWNGSEWVEIDITEDKENLFRNGDFEQWVGTQPRFWSIELNNNTTVSADSDSLTGYRSIKFTTPANSGGVNWKLTSRYIPVDYKMSYELIAFLKNPEDNVSVDVTVRYYDKDKQEISSLTLSPLVPHSSWTHQVRVFFDNSGNAKYMRLELSCTETDANTVYMDNLQLRKKPFFWEAEYMESDVGGISAHWAASSGRYRVALDSDPAGKIIKGPGIYMKQGNYVAHFRLATSNNTSDVALAKLEVVAENGSTEIASRYLYANDFDSVAWSFQTFSLPFRLTNAYSDIEFRVHYYSPPVSLLVDYVCVEESEYWDSESNVQNDDASTGVTAEGSEGSNVACTAGQEASQTSCYPLSWTTLATFTVPNQDHEVYFVHCLIRRNNDGYGMWGAVQLRVKIDEDTYEYYPHENYQYCPHVNATSQNMASTCLITVPKNIAGKQVEIRFYNRYPSGGHWVQYSAWGHAPHTHTLNDPEHTHVINDNEHKHW